MYCLYHCVVLIAVYGLSLLRSACVKMPRAYPTRRPLNLRVVSSHFLNFIIMFFSGSCMNFWGFLYLSLWSEAQANMLGEGVPSEVSVFM